MIESDYIDRTREKDIIFLRLHEKWTLQKIGDKYGISRERVRQILERNEIKGWILPPGKTQYERVFGGIASLARKLDEPWHGTRCGYQYHKCKCDACMEANNAQTRNLKGKTPPSHGLSGYQNYGCKCAICRAAGSERNKYYRQRRKEREAA